MRLFHLYKDFCKDTMFSVNCQTFRNVFSKKYYTSLLMLVLPPSYEMPLCVYEMKKGCLASLAKHPFLLLHPPSVNRPGLRGKVAAYLVEGSAVISSAG